MTGFGSTDDVTYSSAVALAAAIRAREVSSTEVIEAHLRRIEAVNPALNAVVQLAADQARDEARAADASLARGELKGPLHGVPVTIKDSLDVTGMVCAVGTLGRRSFVPTDDAVVVVRLKAAGAIVLGKTNTPELTLASETDNLVYGRTNNPYDRSRTSGGSSGGGAAIIAAGGSPLDLGSDMAGSIRQPCHFCGIAGIKPTSGRVPRTGHVLPPGGLLDSLWQIGPMARRVEDLILTLPIIAGPDWQDPSIVPVPLNDPHSVDVQHLRVAFFTDNGIVPPKPEIAGAVQDTVELLTSRVRSVEEARPAGLEDTASHFGSLIRADSGAGWRKALQSLGTTEAHPIIRDLIEEMSHTRITGEELSELVLRLDAFRRNMLHFLQRYDVIICPVNAYPAWPHGAQAELFPAISYTMTFNLTGLPAATVRVGTSPEGLPIGVQIASRPWREDIVLAVAGVIESALGGWQRPPL